MSSYSLDGQGAPLTPGIAQEQDLAGLREGTWALGKEVGGATSFLGSIPVHPQMCGLLDPPQAIPLRPQVLHSGDHGQGPDTKFMAGQIRHDPAGQASGRAGPTQIFHHPLPNVRTVVGTVDPRELHTPLEQVTEKSLIRGPLPWDGDHDTGAAAFGRWPQQVFTVYLQLTMSTDTVQGMGFGRMLRIRRTGCRREHANDTLQGIADVAFGASKGGQPSIGQSLLQGAQILAAQGQVVQEVQSPRGPSDFGITLLSLDPLSTGLLLNPPTQRL